MDTYTKMLRAKGAEWIQEGHEWKVGDRTDKGIVIECYTTELLIPMCKVSTDVYGDTSKRVKQFNLLWLPSIEDLLRMVDFDSISPRIWVSENIHTVYVGGDRTFNGNNWQECFLQLIQHELKDLKWSGEEWI